MRGSGKRFSQVFEFYFPSEHVFSQNVVIVLQNNDHSCYNFNKCYNDG